MSAYLVETFTHLKEKPQPEVALALLQRVASLVKPIMKKHNWRLPVLAEFYPNNPALQGLMNPLSMDRIVGRLSFIPDVNGGQKICLRLRPAGNQHAFIDEEQVVLVMLHELTHNVHGPHNQNFYKFLSGLETEWEALKRSGYSGEGFHSVGKRVGAGVSHDLPMHKARAKAVEAAEKRAKRQRLLGGPGRTLGGGIRGVGDTRSPRELSAEAAERRARDEKSCAAGDEALVEAQKAAEQSISTTASDASDIAVVKGQGSFDMIDLTLDDSDNSEVKEQTASTSSLPSLRAAQTTAAKTTPSISTPSPLMDKTMLQPVITTQRGEWTCQICTLINDPTHLQCMACESIRSQFTLGASSLSMNKGWICLVCGEEEMEHQFWSCRSCGAIKTDSVR